jgi:hypothetical protein
MGANNLVRQLESMPQDQPLEWKTIRDEIQREADSPNTEEERIILLKLFNATMDRAEQEFSVSAPDKLQALRNVRLADYRLLLIKEAMVGENVCADTFYEITEREIAAGRMSPDDGLRITAAQRILEPHPTRAEMIAIAEGRPAKPRGFFSRLFRA